MDYQPGQYYREGWEDRMKGNNQKTCLFPNGLLEEEYQKGYADCHAYILENEKRTQSKSSPLMGHPLYKEAHEDLMGRVFLSD